MFMIQTMENFQLLRTHDSFGCQPFNTLCMDVHGSLCGALKFLRGHASDLFGCMLFIAKLGGRAIKTPRRIVPWFALVSGTIRNNY